jgi:hypothetical protein
LERRLSLNAANRRSSKTSTVSWHYGSYETSDVDRTAGGSMCPEENPAVAMQRIELRPRQRRGIDSAGFLNDYTVDALAFSLAEESPILGCFRLYMIGSGRIQCRIIGTNTAVHHGDL